MGNVQPKGTSRLDDDADFGASFVLSQGEVDKALASGIAPPSDAAEALEPNATSLLKKLIYAGMAILAALLVVAVSLLGV